MDLGFGKMQLAPLDGNDMDIRIAPQTALEQARAQEDFSAVTAVGLDETAARRGHRVTLMERSSAPGGQLRLAGATHDRREMATLLDDLARQLHSLPVTVVRDMIGDGTPYALVLGTAWGLADTFIKQADYCLEPICGPTDYNHLSVRSAAAILLDRLLGK